MNTPFKITKVTAFVAIDQDGTEGVMAFMNGNRWTPLICADENRIRSMFPMAQEIAKACGRPYRILQFSVREDVTAEINLKYLHQ